MGGHVAVTVRLSSQEEYRMRWGTRGLYLIHERDFMERSGEFWDDRLQQWRTNAELKGTLAPTDYGLVVVDFVTHRILSLQGYTSVGRYNLVHLLNHPDDPAWLADMIEHDKVSHVRAIRRVNDPASPYGQRQDSRTFALDVYGSTPDEQVATLMELYHFWFRADRTQPPAPPFAAEHAAWQPEEAVLNLAPFTITENQGTSHEEWAAAYQAVREMGLTLTSEEEIRWQTWMTHYAPSEEPDA